MVQLQVFLHELRHATKAMAASDKNTFFIVLMIVSDAYSVRFSASPFLSLVAEKGHFVTGRMIFFL